MGRNDAEKCRRLEHSWPRERNPAAFRTIDRYTCPLRLHREFILLYEIHFEKEEGGRDVPLRAIVGERRNLYSPVNYISDRCIKVVATKLRQNERKCAAEASKGKGNL